MVLFSRSRFSFCMGNAQLDNIYVPYQKHSNIIGEEKLSIWTIYLSLVLVVMRSNYVALRYIGVCLYWRSSESCTSGLVADSHDSEEHAWGKPS